MKKILIILLNLSLLYAIDSCIISNDSREIYRQEYLVPERIQSENFVIHFTTADNDYQDINGQLYNLQSNYGYAQSIIDLAEYSLNIYTENGWEGLVPDCDDSITDLDLPNHCINFGGNPLYDIYISNDGVGMVVPENLHNISPYTSGRSSYMKISTLSNNYQSLPSWSHHVIAHEIHHSIQIRYGTGTSGSPGNYTHNLWFFEQTATYMENVIFPYSIHLQTMLGNCNVVTPLTHTNHGIDYPSEIYPYRSALWQKYLVESLGDSSIVKHMWEDYGLQFASGNSVSLFPIYEESINTVTDNQYTMTEIFNEYALWRYFTGTRNIQNNYFENSADYCTSSTFDIPSTHSLWSDKGGAYFINLPSEGGSFIISSEDNDALNCKHVIINSLNEAILTDLPLENNDNYFDIESIDNGSQILILNTSYDSTVSEEINFTIDYDLTNLIGDINDDNFINVLDVIFLVNIILSYPYVIEGSDLNQDNVINVLDVIYLVNIILS